jgi:HPt (histidine-containing phosphotransfer) domain-containing protein
MHLKDCYTSFGGDFDEVLNRLRREQTVQKFIYKFLDDQSFHLFEVSMDIKDYDEALRAVHTLKGICQNFAFTKLYESSDLVTKALKETDYNKAVELAPQLSDDYYQVITAIKEYKKSKEE